MSNATLTQQVAQQVAQQTRTVRGQSVSTNRSWTQTGHGHEMNMNFPRSRTIQNYVQSLPANCPRPPAVRIMVPRHRRNGESADWQDRMRPVSYTHLQPPNPFDIIANIETRRSAVTDKRIAFFAAAFRIPPSRFFPARLTLNWPKDQ